MASFQLDCTHRILITKSFSNAFLCSKGKGIKETTQDGYIIMTSGCPHAGYSWLSSWGISGSGRPGLECGSKGSHILNHPGMLGIKWVFEPQWINIFEEIRRESQGLVWKKQILCSWSKHRSFCRLRSWLAKSFRRCGALWTLVKGDLALCRSRCSGVPARLNKHFTSNHLVIWGSRKAKRWPKHLELRLRFTSGL